ncbi:hypothetical protein [Paraliobacillus quinghaiensis]|uniref:hypothetical protein n=1 Tax=Paraliobacillus quinghaiensis TaxID=470815 RepID=UPI0013C2F65B|nr:hypothetical protein [Paraliobacillus quinghaiensis]
MKKQTNFLRAMPIQEAFLILWEQLMFSMGRAIAVPQVEDPLGGVFYLRVS